MTVGCALSVEDQYSEFIVFVKIATGGSPGKQGLTLVIIYPVKIGLPATAANGRFGEQVHELIGNKEFGSPSADTGKGFPFAVHYRCRMPRAPVSSIVKRNPAIQYPVLIANADGKFKVKRGKLVFEVSGFLFIGLQKNFYYILIPEIKKIGLHGGSQYAVFAGIKEIKTTVGIKDLDLGIIMNRHLGTDGNGYPGSGIPGSIGTVSGNSEIGAVLFTKRGRRIYLRKPGASLNKIIDA
jgi:hypothetical protein